MQETPNLKLKKPDLTDYVNVGDLNENADLIDEAITENKEDLATHLAEDATDAHNISNITGLQTALGGKESTLNANQKRPIYIQSTAPTNPQEGDIWIEVD